jgi:membrane-associated phospholipid phosphatase
LSEGGSPPTSVEGLLEVIRAFDATVDQAFDRIRGNAAADRLFYTASELGDFSLVWHIVNTSKSLTKSSQRPTVRLAVALSAESALVNGVIKSFFGRRRPVAAEPRPHSLRKPRTSSFPSGHASSAAMAAVLLSDDDPLWPLYVGLAVLVASSRVYVRIHHASDVIAGAALGIALGKLTKKLYPIR